LWEPRLNASRQRLFIWQRWRPAATYTHPNERPNHTWIDYGSDFLQLVGRKEQWSVGEGTACRVKDWNRGKWVRGAAYDDN
jgi:hypothetical protein